MVTHILGSPIINNNATDKCENTFYGKLKFMEGKFFFAQDHLLFDIKINLRILCKYIECVHYCRE